MSVIHSLLSRSQKAPQVKVVADFDKLIAEPIGFKFQGKVYVINPVDVDSFMKIANSLGHIESLLKGKGMGQVLEDGDVYQAYHDFIHPICPTLGLKEIRALAVPQLFALLNLIIKHLKGETVEDTAGKTEDEKKNSNVKLRG